MGKLLYITANPKPVNDSLSLSLGKEFLNSYKENHPEDSIIEIDLYNYDLPELDADVLSGWSSLRKGSKFEDLTTEQQKKILRLNTLCQEFSDADKYVFVTPLWNLGSPPRVKTYFDAVCLPGKTFRYTHSGSIGLLKNKKALHIQSRGGIYSTGPNSHAEQGDTFIHNVLEFVGVTDVQSLIAEGMDQCPTKADEIKAEKFVQAKKIAASF